MKEVFSINERNKWKIYLFYILGNTTRFFIIGSECDAPTGDDKTLIMFTLDHRKPGGFYSFHFFFPTKIKLKIKN